MNINIVVTIVLVSNIRTTKCETENNLLEYLQKAKGHATESNTHVFNYVVAILKKSKFLSAGVLIKKNWVMSGADALFLIKDTYRLLRVRLGSTNYKKDGILLPVKHYAIHPYFDDTSPEFDISLIRLAAFVEITNNINPIRMQIIKKEVTATHFIVTAWKPLSKVDLKKKYPPLRTYDINTHHGKKTLQVLHMHPTEPKDCQKYMSTVGVNDTDQLMCLDPGPDARPCEREGGAPMVLNRVLWGIVSSWAPENCTKNPGPLVVNLLSAPSISEWVHLTINDGPGNKQDDEEILYDQMNDDYAEDVNE